MYFALKEIHNFGRLITPASTSLLTGVDNPDTLNGSDLHPKVRNKLLKAVSILGLSQVACSMNEFYIAAGATFVAVSIFGLITYFNDPEVRANREDRALPKQLQKEEAHRIELEYLQHKANHRTRSRNLFDTQLSMEEYHSQKERDAQRAEYLSTMVSRENMETAIQVVLTEYGVTPQDLVRLRDTNEGKQAFDQLKYHIGLVHHAGSINKNEQLVVRFGKKMANDLKNISLLVKRDRTD